MLVNVKITNVGKNHRRNGSSQGTVGENFSLQCTANCHGQSLQNQQKCLVSIVGKGHRQSTI